MSVYKVLYSNSHLLLNSYSLFHHKLKYTDAISQNCLTWSVQIIGYIVSECDIIEMQYIVLFVV